MLVDPQDADAPTEPGKTIRLIVNGSQSSQWHSDSDLPAAESHLSVDRDQVTPNDETSPVNGPPNRTPHHHDHSSMTPVQFLSRRTTGLGWSWPRCLVRVRVGTAVAAVRFACVD
jgi:hypothetical protein